MSKIDLTQLIKILNLTQSDSDGEALTAIRMVNQKIKAAGLTWEILISAQSPHKSTQKQYRWKEMPEYYDRSWFKKTVEEREFTSTLDQSEVEWVNKLIRFNNKHGYLPEEAWTNYRKLWHNFRERTAV